VRRVAAMIPRLWPPAVLEDAILPSPEDCIGLCKELGGVLAICIIRYGRKARSDLLPGQASRDPSLRSGMTAGTCNGKFTATAARFVGLSLQDAVFLAVGS